MIEKKLFLFFIRTSSLYFLAAYLILIIMLSEENRMIMIVRFISDSIHFGFFYIIALIFSKGFSQELPYKFYMKFIIIFLILMPFIFVIRDYKNHLYLPANATLIIGIFPQIIGVYFFRRKKL